MGRTKDYSGPMCGAKPKPGGVRTWPCKIPPMEGEKRCRMHGGKHANNAVNKAKARTKVKVEKALRKLDVVPVEDPLTELKTLAGEAVAWKNEMGRLVAQLTQIRYRTENSEQTRAEVALFERAMDRCTTVLATIAKLGIDERLAAISEQQATMLTNALFAAFDAAGFTIIDVTAKRAITKEFTGQLRLVS